MAYAPQNTIPAFDVAWDQGADGIELDVQLTSDGKLACYHDDDLSSLSDGQGPVRLHSMDQLKQLDLGSSFHPDFAGTPMPCLDEVLERVPGHGIINIEVKTSMPHVGLGRAFFQWMFGQRPLEPSVRERLQREADGYGSALHRCLEGFLGRDPSLLQRIVVSSFDPMVLQSVARLIPGIQLGLLQGPSTLYDTGPWFHDHGWYSWHPYHRIATKKLCATAHDRGVKVFAWTVNSLERASTLLRHGVDGIITNDPISFIRAFKSLEV